MNRRRLLVLILAAQGVLFADACSQVLDTIYAAFSIVDIWV